nr:MAG TPA: hypothetical protein [Caudoviricetes sp.]
MLKLRWFSVQYPVNSGFAAFCIIEQNLLYKIKS